MISSSLLNRTSILRIVQNTVLKTWQGKPENVKLCQEKLLMRAKANSDAQQGKYDASGESKEAGKGMYEKGYVYCKSKYLDSFILYWKIFFRSEFIYVFLPTRFPPCSSAEKTSEN